MRTNLHALSITIYESPHCANDDFVFCHLHFRNDIRPVLHVLLVAIHLVDRWYLIKRLARLTYIPVICHMVHDDKI